MTRTAGHVILFAGTLLGVFSLSAVGAKAALTLVAIPVNSMDGASYPTIDNVWSDDPSDGYTGIGHLVDPTIDSIFAMHDHQYVAPNVPDPSRAIVTYGFDVPTNVSSIDIVEHVNGISLIEAFVGNSLGSMTSIGVYSGSAGPGPYAEQGSNVFSFVNPFNTLYFQFIVRGTYNPDGYAAYRAFPTVASAVPEAGALVVWGTILASLGAVAKFRRNLFG